MSTFGVDASVLARFFLCRENVLSSSGLERSNSVAAAFKLERCFSNAPKQLSTMNCAVCSILLGRSCVVFGSNTKRAWCFSVSASQSLLTQRAIFS